MNTITFLKSIPTQIDWISNMSGLEIFQSPRGFGRTTAMLYNILRHVISLENFGPDVKKIFECEKIIVINFNEDFASQSLRKFTALSEEMGITNFEIKERSIVNFKISTLKDFQVHFISIRSNTIQEYYAKKDRFKIFIDPSVIEIAIHKLLSDIPRGIKGEDIKADHYDILKMLI